MRRPLSRFCLLLCALAPCLSTARAGHPERNYKGQFDFAVTLFQPISATDVLVRGSLDGIETILGKFTGEVEYHFDPNTGAFSGSLTKKGANGDLLYEDLTGQFTETGSVGSFTITGGTGRFRHATGKGVFKGVWTAPDLSTAHITFHGSLHRAKVGDYEAEGKVAFSNVQGATQVGGLAPYLAAGESELIGKHTQTGSILNLSGLIPVDATTLIFYGEVGPNPLVPGHPKLHVITTKQGQIFCTWTAVFTLKILNAKGDAVFSGDGAFTIVGGTGKYKDASGTFTTLFETKPVPAGADKAIADYQQSGEIVRH
ncbi:hypothetical protein P12x_005646 [Tundrisphaera lichenicola]|uniref:hypothetical protein n=1 Tax=Tundrisphaera lichenicola TaxID=2029860 RepID=UPI003EB770DC